MKQEVQNWWQQAKDDLDAAEYTFRGARYRIAAFLCQQAVEKAFKALLLEKTGIIRKIHDLVELGKDLDIPDRLLAEIKELTLAYIYSRYPDVKQEPNLKEKVNQFLKSTKEAMQWVEENL